MILRLVLEVKLRLMMSAIGIDVQDKESLNTLINIVSAPGDGLTAEPLGSLEISSWECWRCYGVDIVIHD